MGQDPGHSATTGDGLITAYLVGEHWGPAETAMDALARRGTVRFTRYAAPVSPPEAAGHDFKPLPTVVVVGPGVLPGERDLLRCQEARKATPLGLLDCVTSADLETSNLLQDADDFVVVPCTPAELDLRIRRLSERYAPHQSHPALIVGEISLDPDSYQVTVAGRRVGLAWMEFQLLKFLMGNVGRVFSREQLLANVWGVDSFGGTRTVDVHIRRLRNKIEVRGDKYFRTVKNVGYGMDHPGRFALQ